MPASIFNGDAVKLLKNKLKFKDGTTVTSTEMSYVEGVTSDIQTQLNAKANLSGTAVTSITSNYTALTTDTHISSTANSNTITLYAVSGNSGRQLVISNDSGNDIIVTPNSTETFSDGSTDKYLSQDQSLVIDCNGSEWIIKSYIPLIGYLRDLKATSTAGGSATSGSWQTRDLNTATGDFTKFGSLSTNQFTLEAGTYHIESYAPCFAVDGSVTRLQNTSDASTVLDGTIARSGSSAAEGVSYSIIKGDFSITSTKTFEIQNRVQTTKATNGYGTPGSDAGSTQNEVYTSVKLTKVV
jgi:hypothetical protein